MLYETLLADLLVDLPNAVRLQRLVSTLRERFHCGAVGLLRLDGDSLRPVAAEGLVHEALGRRFVIAQHPRLAAIMASREPTWFEPDSRLPDPYDGLLDNHVGEPLPVHDCMGMSLYVEGQLWGALTLDALHPGTFDSETRRDLARYSLLIEAAVRVTRLEQGAFSGAAADRPGRFDAANGGTLLLDEVGELPLSVQAKLLRVLQNGEIQRLGADKPLHVDVRIIAATNRNLPDSIRDGHFRADLYHRLSVYPVLIPPLRDREQDVLMLAGHFLELNRARLGLRSMRLSPAAERAMLTYGWPGNVRELEHVISRAAVKLLSRGASRMEILTLEPDLLDLDSTAEQSVSFVPMPPQGAQDVRVQALRESVENCQRQSIQQALDTFAGNWASAARALELDPSNLHKLARRLGLK